MLCSRSYQHLHSTSEREREREMYESILTYELNTIQFSSLTLCSVFFYFHYFFCISSVHEKKNEIKTSSNNRKGMFHLNIIFHMNEQQHLNRKNNHNNNVIIMRNAVYHFQNECLRWSLSYSLFFLCHASCQLLSSHFSSLLFRTSQVYIHFRISHTAASAREVNVSS